MIEGGKEMIEEIGVEEGEVEEEVDRLLKSGKEIRKKSLFKDLRQVDDKSLFNY